MKEKIVSLFRLFIMVGMLAGAYIYNVKFIQIGIPALGRDILHLAPLELGAIMASLAILTCIIALIWGFRVDALCWSVEKKVNAVLIIGIFQLFLTVWAPYIISVAALLFWVLLTSLTLGIGIPISLPLFFELVPPRNRGLIAGLISGGAYSIGNLSIVPWTTYDLMLEAVFFMAPGLLALLIIKLFGLFPTFFYDEPDEQKLIGRFPTASIAPLLILMFTIFFIDSLGFLRIIEEPSLIIRTWNSPLQTRAILAVIHLITGILAGLLYQKTNGWVIGLVSLGLFIVADFAFVQYSPTWSDNRLLFIALIYCTTVSVYTVNNFCLWSDVSTRKNIGKNASLGIAVGGWLASFLSTALAYYLHETTPFNLHLLFPAILAMIAFIGVAFYKLKFEKHL